VVNDQLEALPFMRISYDLLDAVLKGFSVGEVMWSIDSGVTVSDVIARDQRRFTFDYECRMRLLTLQNPLYGEALPERKFIVHRFGSKDANPYGLGMGNRLFWPVFFKRQTQQFWLTFLDKFGSPTALGKYPAGSSAPAKQALLSALSAISQEAQIAVPAGMEVTLLEGAKSGNSGYEDMCRYLDDEMSKAVLGETMSTTSKGAGMGSGQSKVHNEVLADTLNGSLLTWITQYNVPGAKPPRIEWDVSESPDRLQTAQADEIVMAMGYEPSDDYIADTYGAGWTKAPPPPPPAPGQFTPGSAFPGQLPQGAPPLKQPSTNVQMSGPNLQNVQITAPGSDPVSQQAEAMAQAADPALQAWIGTVKGIVQKAKSMDDLREQLLDAFPAMSIGDLAKAMQAGFAAATLAGRYDLLQ
jgi:phage gp29-like protein